MDYVLISTGFLFLVGYFTEKTHIFIAKFFLHKLIILAFLEIGGEGLQIMHILHDFIQLNGIYRYELMFWSQI